MPLNFRQLNLIYEEVISYIGIPLAVIFACCLAYGTLKVLMNFAKNLRSTFSLFSKTFGMLVSIFGLLLYLRGYRWEVALLEVWVGTIMMQSFPILQLIQAIVALTISWIYWVRELYFHSTFFVEVIGDGTFFLILPTLFILAQLNYESQSAIPSANPKFYGPRIPISKYI